MKILFSGCRVVTCWTDGQIGRQTATKKLTPLPQFCERAQKLVICKTATKTYITQYGRQRCSRPPLANKTWHSAYLLQRFEGNNSHWK